MFSIFFFLDVLCYCVCAASDVQAQWGAAGREHTAPWLKMFQNAREFCDVTEEAD